MVVVAAVVVLGNCFGPHVHVVVENRGMVVVG